MNILIMISGGISAYKIPSLIRLFKKNNDKVKVVTTSSALQYVGRLTLKTLSDGLYTDNDFLTNDNSITHTYLAKWADNIIIAPATANTIAKISHGYSDNLLGQIILATNKSVYIVPAMNIYICIIIRSHKII